MASSTHTYSPTASLADLWDEGSMAMHALGVVSSTIPVIVVGKDGNSRPVVAFDIAEEGDGETVTGRALVIRTGSHDDPHPMSVEGDTAEARAFHERKVAEPSHNGR